MQKEIYAAVNWWSEQIKPSAVKHDNGDGFQSALANFVNSRQPPVTEAQIRLFKEALTALLPEYLGNSGWTKALENPNFGSALRTLAVDYEADGILRAAAQLAGIKYTSLLFPLKTVMWVNPGKVTVSKGYGSPEEVVYGQ